MKGSDTWSTRPALISPGKPVRPRQVRHRKARQTVEKNGVLNFNRRFSVRVPNPVAYARAEFHAETSCQADVSLGFSDRVRVLVNGTEVYQGEWCWGPPETDGRIRPGQATLKVPLRQADLVKEENLVKEADLVKWRIGTGGGNSEGRQLFPPRSQPIIRGVYQGRSWCPDHRSR